MCYYRCITNIKTINKYTKGEKQSQFIRGYLNLPLKMGKHQEKNWNKLVDPIATHTQKQMTVYLVKTKLYFKGRKGECSGKSLQR